MPTRKAPAANLNRTVKARRPIPKSTAKSEAVSAAASAGTPASALTHPSNNNGTAPTQTQPRRLRPPSTKRFSFSKRRKHPGTLPKARHIGWNALLVLYRNWKLFAGIIVIYALLTAVLVHGLGAGASSNSLQILLGSGPARFVNSIDVLTTLVSSSSSGAGSTAGVYQIILTIVGSLAVIWAYRQVLAGAVSIRIRDAFYKGMYPLVPVLLVMLVIGLQLLPMIIGASIYVLVVTNGIAAVAFERFLWEGVFLLSALLSIYMISSSIFALYIATLPDMTPLQALRSARGLVRYRRWTVLRKILFLPLVLLVIVAAVMLPTILFLTGAAAWMLFVLTILGLPVIHAYMYSLYRELLV